MPEFNTRWVDQIYDVTAARSIAEMVPPRGSLLWEHAVFLVYCRKASRLLNAALRLVTTKLSLILDRR